jgi:putative ABC transport system substrate-binding protein
LERITLEGRYERAPFVFRDLVTRGVDVIVPPNPLPLLNSAKSIVKTTPMVAVLNFDPVISGLVDSLARPGGNLTGIASVTGPEIQNRRLQLLRDFVPQASKIAYLGPKEHWDMFGAGPEKPGPPEIFSRVETTSDFDAAFAQIKTQGADAIFVSSGAMAYANAPRIIRFATDHRLPTSFHAREPVEAGGLMSYGVSTPRLYDQIAQTVDKVLRGKQPHELPVEQPIHFETVINVKAAKMLGLPIPQLLLLQADELIE